MVPVLDNNNKPLMPCSEKRARQMMDKKQASPHWQKGFFCIKLIKEPSDRKYQKIVLGLDTGSKREGYTVATKNAVVLNITTNTPDWIKDHLESRRNLRRARRQRKTPYRQMRANRTPLRNSNRLPPSTKARWDAKLRIIKILIKILPLTHLRTEDIQFRTIKGKKNKKNSSFSPLETGKKYFENQTTNLGLIFSNNSGYETYQYRNKRGFKKSKKKLEYKWETHNVDSHCLVEIELGKEINPYYGMYQINFLEFHRRQLQVQNPTKGNIRKPYGTTISMGMSRGSVVKYRDKLYYLGGSSKGKVAIYSILTGKRINQFVGPKEIKIMYNNSFRTQYLPFEKQWKEIERLTK